MTFEETDLDVSQDELDQITARLSNSDESDPIGDAIKAQSQKVNDYTLRYEIADERFKRLLRPLVLWDLYTKMGPVPSNIDTAYKDAMAELTAIRDGKFPDLKQKDVPDPGLAPSTGRFGGAHHISFGDSRHHG